MSGTKVAFSERTLRPIKSFLHLYMEEYGYNYIYRLPQFVRILISGKTRSINLKPKDVRNSEFLSDIYSKPLREYRKPKFTIGDRVSISKNDLPLRKGYKLQLTPVIFEFVAIATREPPTYTLEDDQVDTIGGMF